MKRLKPVYPRSQEFEAMYNGGKGVPSTDDARKRYFDNLEKTSPSLATIVKRDHPKVSESYKYAKAKEREGKRELGFSEKVEILSSSYNLTHNFN